MKIVVIVSGGMDSVTLAHDLHAQGHELHLLSVDYGQRHVKELEYAANCAKVLEVPYDVADLRGVVHLLGGSSLTDMSIPVPEGHYAEESMKATVVPNRNAIMLAVAMGLAVTAQADAIATGVHAGDHYVYPDCRPQFINQLADAFRAGNEGFIAPTFDILTPYIGIGKHDIATIGSKLDTLDYTQTWSCYKGEETHCGVCGTCVERKEAFQFSGVNDPTVYTTKTRPTTKELCP